MSPSPLRRPLAGALVAGSLAVSSLLASPSAVVTAVESAAADPFLFGLVVAGLYLVRPVLAWPTTPLAAVVGYGYGVAVGVPIALLGVVVTVIPVFLAARWFSEGCSETAWTTLPFGRSIDRGRGAVVGYYETAGPLRGVTASRLAPIPSDIATCAAAVSGVRLRHLAIGTAVGELPWTVAAVTVGASAATITTDGLGSLGAPLVVGCAFAAALLLAEPAYRVARHRLPQ